jgi:hypothetical protein
MISSNLVHDASNYLVIKISLFILMLLALIIISAAPAI